MSIGQRADAAERKLMEKEREAQAKQSLQDSERVGNCTL
jgi:hypothetical protein